MNKVTSLGVDFYFENGKPKYFLIGKTFGNKEDQLVVASQNLESIINKKIVIKSDYEFDVE
jgi:hypothetical protein